MRRPTRAPRRARAPARQPRRATFGPVSTISSAPVALGNSMSGFTTQVLHTPEGVRVIGRDYAFTPAGTGSVATWTLVGGMPLTPACMPSSVLKSYCIMYNKFKWNKCRYHYISTSATTATGDVVFYYSKQQESQLPECQSGSFLPLVLSDSHTVIGPQWKNHTTEIVPKTTWMGTDYGADQSSVVSYTAGDLFLYSKTSTTDSPGWVVFDYDITFKTLSVNPRAGFLPIVKAQWIQASLVNGTVSTADVTAITLSVGTSGIGSTTIPALSVTAGDIFEFAWDSTNSTYGIGSTAATAFAYIQITTAITFPVKDGLRVFLGADGSNSLRIYNTLADALTNTCNFRGHQTITYADTYRGFAKFITSTNPNVYAQQY